VGAATAYRKVIENADVGKKRKALSEVALGMIAGRSGVKAKSSEKRAEKFASAKKHFEAAIKIEHPKYLQARPPKPGEEGDEQEPAKPPGKPAAFGDACAGLGLLALYAGQPREAERHFRQALTSGAPLGKEILPELFNGLGLAVANQGKLTAAPRYFTTAKNYAKSYGRKKWTVPDDNLKMVSEGTVGMPGLKPGIRKQLLDGLAKRVTPKKGGNYQQLNAMGCGYYYLRDDKKTEDYLLAAIKMKPEIPDARLNMLALRWRQTCNGRARHLELQAQFFPPPKIDPRELRWKTPLLKQGIKPKLAKADQQKCDQARTTLRDSELKFNETAKAVMAKVKGLPVNMEQALMLARLHALFPTAKRLSGSSDTKKKKQGGEMLKEAESLLAAGLKKFPAEPRFARLQGLRLLDARDLTGTMAAFDRSLAANPDQPELKEFKKEFQRKPEVVGFRPAATPGAGGLVLASSARPLLGAIFRGYTARVPFPAEKVRLTLDGQQVPGVFWGSEMLYLPAQKLADGEHVLAAEAEDVLGGKAAGQCKFLVDNSPPTITRTEPADGGTIKGPRPRLVIHYHDKYSGVDPASVEIEIRSEPGASTLFKESPVRGGRYIHNNAALGIKSGTQVGAEKVVFSASLKLGPGKYKVIVTVGDVRGLKITKSWTFVVVK